MDVLDDFDLRIKAKFADVCLERSQMHDYQHVGYEFLLANPFSGLFIDMGLGKTVTSATVICDLLAHFDNDDKVLIIGPLRVATATWPDEFRRWRHLAPFNFSVIHVDDDDPRIGAARLAAVRASRAENTGRAMFKSDIEKEAAKAGQRAEADMRNTIRAEQARSRASIHIISRDWVEWLVGFYATPKRGSNWPYRTVIVDESSGFKDYDSKRFMALASIRNTPGLITRLHILTATPAAETYESLFAQIFLLDRGERFGIYITKFRNRYFTQNRWSLKWEIREGAEEEITAKIADICLVMKAKDYLDMEEPIYVRRDVELRPAERLLYDTMATDMIVKLDDGTKVEAKTAAALSQKLGQIASGVLYDSQILPGEDPDDPDAQIKINKVYHIHYHKIDMLKQIVEESQGQPIMVGYSHRASLDRLQKHFPKAVKMDKAGKVRVKWNQGKIPMLLMHPASGGHGLNLQDGGHIVVYFDIPWSLELYQQFIGRLARQGQKYQVTVFLIVCKGTMDERQVEALASKNDAQDLLFKLLQRMRRKFAKMAKAAAAEAIAKALTSSKGEVDLDL
jgi:hypothetical protein